MLCRIQRRRGATLIEVIAYMSCFSVIISLMAAVFQAAYASQRAGQQTATAVANINRFSEQFRRDVHVASAASLDGAALELELLGERVTYRMIDRYVQRELFDVDNKPLSQDAFDLKSGRDRLEWTVDEQLITLVLLSENSTIRWRVQAHLR